MALTYRAEEAIRMIQASLGVNVTYQRLKHLDDNELLGDVERSDGRHRLYTLGQIERATVAIALLELGMEVRWVKALMNEPKIPVLPDEPRAAMRVLTSGKTTDFDDDALYAIDFAQTYWAGLTLLETKVYSMLKVFSYLTAHTPEVCDAIDHVTRATKARLEELAKTWETKGRRHSSTAQNLRRRKQRVSSMEQGYAKVRLLQKELVRKLAESASPKT
jgi:DNA-binding transcriptional MerR regulator